MHIVDQGDVQHAFTQLIRGATQFAPWVRNNIPVSLADLAGAKCLAEVIGELAALLCDGDVIIAHNCDYDLQKALASTAEKEGINSLPEVQ